MFKLKIKVKLQERATMGQKAKEPHRVFQITIPKALVKLLSWKKGDTITMMVRGYTLRLQKENGEHNENKD